MQMDFFISYTSYSYSVTFEIKAKMIAVPGPLLFVKGNYNTLSTFFSLRYPASKNSCLALSAKKEFSIWFFSV